MTLTDEELQEIFPFGAMLTPRDGDREAFPVVFNSGPYEEDPDVAYAWRTEWSRVDVDRKSFRKKSDTEYSAATGMGERVDLNVLPEEREFKLDA